ncbi:dienelactone hydrolase family protein [Amycolatopsis sp.]|uniref:dienelactone hydrolase family protein n=1 Tax=Amycolatopsis sp. TaxID=37632 RepID=UPI002C36ED12|nr:dienelactone hydrolase family protein [Amycolatopsis sp.]HVV09282.1 dienelactone hydrolase family protein [Amycolatopsis sp.]
MTDQVESRFIEVDGLRAHLTLPAAGTPPRAATLLLPMITGIGKRVREFGESVTARTGALTLAWDPWHGKCSDDTEFAELQRLHAALDDETALHEQRRLLDHLRREFGTPAPSVAGWCLGGRLALILGARTPELSAVVAFHPTLPLEPEPGHSIDAIDAAGAIAAPVMVHYPGKDSLVPWENFTRLQTALQGRDTESATIVHLYPRAKHGFSDDRRHGEQVNADAWAVSWPQTLEFLKSTANRKGKDA